VSDPSNPSVITATEDRGYTSRVTAVDDGLVAHSWNAAGDDDAFQLLDPTDGSIVHYSPGIWGTSWPYNDNAGYIVDGWMSPQSAGGDWVAVTWQIYDNDLGYTDYGIRLVQANTSGVTLGEFLALPIVDFPYGIAVQPYRHDRIVFSAFSNEPYIYAHKYPSLDKLDAKSTTYNGGPAPLHTYNVYFDNTAERRVYGLTLLPDARLACLVRNSGASTPGGEIITFDTSSLESPPVVEALYNAGVEGGIMEGHIGYNHVDNMIYIADSYGYGVDPGYFPNNSGWGTSLIAIRVGTWQRYRVVEFPLATGYEMVMGGMTVAGDGGVWYLTNVSGNPQATYMHRYDPQTGTDHVFGEPDGTPIPVGNINYWGVDPLALSDSTVLLYTGEEDWTAVYRYRWDDLRITRNRFNGIADLHAGASPDGWWGTYNNPDDVEEGWVWQGYNLWTYNRICSGGFGPAVGAIAAE
jgi:hypothetical protein